MKALLVFVSALLLSQANAATYYISNSAGSDNRSNLQAQSSGTPWKTIAKINAITFAPGDSILFKRGDVFYGTLNVNQSGTASAPIVFGAYGSGEKPVISGLTTVSNWKNTSGNIYEYYNASYPATVNMVVVDGAFQPLGRYPKANAKNGGWLINQTHVGHSSLTSKELAGVPSFVGGEIVMKKFQWILDKGRVTNQTSSDVALNHYEAPGHPTVYYEIMDNHGFFFQNHINTLTQPKEWCYDNGGKKILMYAPGSSTVEVSTLESLVTIYEKEFVRFDNISFKGANSTAISITSASSNIAITNCNISFTGINAIQVEALTSKVSVEGCNISYTNNNAIEAGNSRDWLIQNNTITNTGMTEGMGCTGDGQYNAISYTSDGSLIQYNKIIKTGYLGIHFSGNNTTVKNNYVDSFVMIKGDGGGIYTYGEKDKTNRLVTGNIVINGIGNLYGLNESPTNPFGGQVHGIYLDGGAANVTITNNTAANCSHSGIWLSSPKGILATGNTLYNNAVTQLKVAENIDKISNFSFRQNILFGTDSAKLIGSFILKMTSLPSMGNIDSNYYTRPLYEPTGVSTYGYPNVPTLYNYPGGGIIEGPDNKFYSLDTWKSLSKCDLHSTKSDVSVNSLNKIRFEYNNTNFPKTISIEGSYVDVKNKTFTNSVTLEPYTSIILIKSSAAALSNQTISFDAITNKTEGDASFQLNATASSGLPVSFKIVSGAATVSGSTLAITGTGTIAVEASQPGNTNYNPATPVTQSFQVAAKQACKVFFVNNGTIVLDATCGNKDGNISIIPTSGVAPFKYSIDGGATYVAGADAGYGFQNLGAGIYKLKLKDAAGCESDVVEKTVKSLYCETACTPPTFNSNSISTTDASCGKNDGKISLKPASGTAPFMYSKDGGTTYVTSTNTEYLFADLAAGTYKLRVKDAKGCESDIVEKIVKSLTCETTCTAPTFVNNGMIVLDATCGNKDGNISIIPITGTAPFRYSIDGGITYISSSDKWYGFMNLGAGTYKLRLKDANGCESEIVEKTVKALYCPTSTCTPPTFSNNSFTVTDASCGKSDGKITVIAANGTAPYMYSKNGGATYTTGADAGYTFANLSPATYRVRVKDAKGCESEIVEKLVKSLNCVTVCTPPTFVNNGLIVLDATCGNKDGNISILPLSGAAPFMYSIDGGITYKSGPDKGFGFMNLGAGTYKLRLKDANGCESAIIERNVRNQNCASATGSIAAAFSTISSIAQKVTVSTYPNPTKGQFKVTLSHFTPTDAQVLVYDAKGTVIQKKVLFLSKVTTTDFDLSKEARGMYYIKIISKDETQVSKVLVQ